MDKELDIDFTAKLCFTTGIPFTKPDKYRKLSRFYTLAWRLYVFIPLYMIATFFTAATIQVYKSYEDQKTTISYGIFGVYVITFTWKLLVIILNAEEYDKIFNDIRALAGEFNSKKDGYDKIQKFYYRPIKKLMAAIFNGVLVTSIFYDSGLIIGSYFTEKKNRALLIHSWVPYDAFENPAFMLTTIYQGIAGTFLVVRNTVVDFIPLTILTVLTAQLKYLQIRLESLFEEPNEDGNFEEKIEWWIKCHQKILKSIEDFKRLCSYNLRCTYVGAMVDFFLGGMAVTTPNLDWDIFKLLTIMGNLLVPVFQLYVMCLIADNLADAGLSTVNGGLSLKLMSSSKSIRNSLAFATLRSTKPIRFTVARLYPLCVETFRDMIRLTVTYFVTVVQIRSRFSSLQEISD